MATALIRAAPLKPEIRLGQAISLFLKDLDTKQKSQFEWHRDEALASPPGIEGVMRLIALINTRSSRDNSRIGPRLMKLIQAVQHFAAMGDMVLGHSENILASSIWSLLRLSLLVSQI